MNARKKSSKSSWVYLDDAPEWPHGVWDRAEFAIGAKVIHEAPGTLTKRGRPPVGDEPKLQWGHAGVNPRTSVVSARRHAGRHSMSLRTASRLLRRARACARHLVRLRTLRRAGARHRAACIHGARISCAEPSPVAVPCRNRHGHIQRHLRQRSFGKCLWPPLPPCTCRPGRHACGPDDSAFTVSQSPSLCVHQVDLATGTTGAGNCRLP